MVLITEAEYHRFKNDDVHRHSDATAMESEPAAAAGVDGVDPVNNNETTTIRIQPSHCRKDLLEQLRFPDERTGAQAVALVLWLNSTAPGWYNPLTMELTGVDGSDVIELVQYVVTDKQCTLRRPPIGAEEFLKLLRCAPSHVNEWSDYANW